MIEQLTLEAEPCQENPHFDRDEWAKDAMHFRCTLRRENVSGALEFFYSVGPGIWRQFMAEHRPFRLHIGTTWSLEEAQRIMRTGTYMGRRVIASEKLLANAKREAEKHFRPELRDVLECLLSDAHILDYDDDQIDEWAEDLGGFEKVSHALKTWRICRGQSAKLRRICGGDLDPLRRELESEEGS